MTVGDDQATALPVFFADVDTGVDDAMALVYLLASSDANLVGIASTGGNVDVDQVCRNNLGLLELCGGHRDPGVAGGRRPTAEHGDAHGRRHPRAAGLGYAELPVHERELTSYDAAEAWVRAAHDLPGELIGLVTGPMTNLALAVRDEPNLPSLLRRLVIMGGGAFDYRGNTTPVAEWNISVDPEAAAEVFDAWGGRAADANTIAPHQLPIVCGLNLTESIQLTPKILSRLAVAADTASTAMSVLDSRGTRSTADNGLIRALEDAMRFYFEFHFDQGEGGYLAHLHDPLAAAVALDPGLIQTRGDDGRRRTHRNAHPRHDDRRLEPPVGGPGTQRARRHRRRSGGVLRSVHRTGGPVRAAACSFVDAFQIPPALPIAQQQRGSRLTGPAVHQHLSAGRPARPGLLALIPPPFVHRPRPGPPAQHPPR